MIEIQNINFKLKTIDNVKCSYGNVKDIQMSMIEELKEILSEKLDKKNTALSDVRTIKQVYDYFKSDDIYTLLQKEQEIINFIEDKYKTSLSSISSKLCGVLKCYTVLNVESKLLKGRIQHFKTLLKVKKKQTKRKLWIKNQ